MSGSAGGRLSADVLVIGAGPAGAAAAIVLARRGLDVLLVDRSSFPRDKVCGDGLIPDALAALGLLGVRDRVLARAHRSQGIKLYAPNGRTVLVAGDCAVIRRRELDELLGAAAVESGARFLSPYRAVAPMCRGSRLAGAIVRHAVDGAAMEIEAPWTILATGAAVDVLAAFGMCRRREPSAVAARLYMRVPSSVAADLPFLVMSYDRLITPGYGWLFPGPDDVINVGVAVFRDGRRPPRAGSLRAVMERFLDTCEVAHLVSRAAVSRTPLVGAPLRTGLTGAELARPGLLVAGEAEGSTYSLSGEGIGKALETGMMAATTIDAGLKTGAPAEAVAAEYVRRVEAAFRDRFRAYSLAQRFVAYPVVGNFLAWRANAGSFVRSQLEGLFNETTQPGALFSPLGFLMALWR